MTDKVQKIREWVLYKQDNLMDEDGYFEYPEDRGAYNVLSELDDYIDSLQEEPVSEELKKCASKIIFEGTNFNKSWYAHPELAFKAGANWQKAKDESITKDLGEYINKLSKQFPEVSFAKLSRIAVRVAKWQEKQDQKTIELAEDHAMLAGMNKMEEQMMEKAVDAQCFGFQGAALFSFRLPASNYLVGSKVKVIVINED